MEEGTAEGGVSVPDQTINSTSIDNSAEVGDAGTVSFAVATTAAGGTAAAECIVCAISTVALPARMDTFGSKVQAQADALKLLVVSVVVCSDLAARCNMHSRANG